MITKLADLSAESVSEIKAHISGLKERVLEFEQIVTRMSSISEHQVHAIHEMSDAMHELTIVADQIETLSKKV